MAIYLTRKLSIIQRVKLPIVIALEAGVVIFLLAGRSVEGWIDFPAGKTVTRSATIPIARTYQTRGKGSSQYIQILPFNGPWLPRGLLIKSNASTLHFVKKSFRPHPDAAECSP